MKEQQIESLELTLKQWQEHENDTIRGKQIIKDIEQELLEIKADNQKLQDNRTAPYF